MRELIETASPRGGLPPDDVVGLLVPLFGQVGELHERGLVAPLRGLSALAVVDGRVLLDASAAAPPSRNRAAIAEVERAHSAALEVDRGADVTRDLSGAWNTRPNSPSDSATPVTARIVPGWQIWEHTVGHHDELTDIASLGELLAALLGGLDLADEADAAELAKHHRNLFAINPRIHPVLAAVASSMIEPDRRRRGQDLGGLLERLETYRDQPEDFDPERVLAGVAGATDRRGALLGHLRDRLFDLSRRNPLLHFRRTQRTLNLTEASVPLVLDLRNITPAHLFTWGGPATRKLAQGKPVELSSVVRWEDAPYATQSLDALISAARRDRAEYGQDQLRLVVAFLHWHDMKNAPAERISSPFVLAPVALTKQRGVRDSYRLSLTSADAEVNPVLRHQLRELYGIALPERVDLSGADGLESLMTILRAQAQASEPGLQINLVDKPRIELVRHRAEVELRAYRRRRSSSAPMIGRRHYAHSYRHPNYQPLGIQIFRDRLLRQPIPIAAELGDRPVPRRAVVPETVDQDMFSLKQEGEHNPYSWDVDLCSVTLANFNYRTLSLVRDYESLMAEPRINEPFDELFSSSPRDVPAVSHSLPLPERYLVVAADDSQTAAIAQARTADNFVIQGPPGTGKSQTITNMIADCVARGQRVLFVCQKRAALDVVHARLRALGLDELCTLIHDSQADRKSFVLGLKDTYERWLAHPEPAASASTAEKRRDGLIADIEAALAEIRTYESALIGNIAGISLIEVIEQLVGDQASRWGENLKPGLRRMLPAAGAWKTAAASVQALTSALRRADGVGILARSPLRLLDTRILGAPHADAEIAHRAGAAIAVADAVHELLVAGGGPADLTVARARQVADLISLLAPVAARGRGSVLDPAGAAAYDLGRAVETQGALRQRAAQTAAAAVGWRSPLGAQDAVAALAIARAKETAALRLFSGGWRRVRRLVRAGYQAPGEIPPTVTAALELLVAAQEAEAAVAEFGDTSQRQWGHADPAILAAGIQAARRYPADLATWRDKLAGEPSAAEELRDLGYRLGELDAAISGLLVDTDDLPLSALRADLATLTTPATQSAIRAAAGPLRDLAATPDGDQVLRALRRLDAEADQIGYAVAAATVQDARANAPILDGLDGAALSRQLEMVAKALPELNRANAEVITARLRQRFLENVEHSGRSVTGMNPQDRVRKKEWAAGRRELEHEFGKVRAYKAIRQLASDESGVVVAGMRPVWLISPASVSDALPLAESFDIVVYDEASQVPVEEAVPALHRARQVVVVGDRMQLPPTSYFQSRVAADDEDETDDQRLGVVLDADSFLAVSSVRLPSTMLTWHYRSRYEALIQFSNAAFYEGRLATIPDREPTAPQTDSLETEGEPDDGAVATLADELLARSVSFVRVRDGIYEQRTNPAEARIIAQLVRELLHRDTGLTFGIVAFSEAQQGEIERALERLAGTDGGFAARYEAELNREEDGQAVGLFVKNLENVQGDERDVIIMSVCYAAGPDGRMRMNFGPINNAGGEKRLNVIFSRAKQHMAVVSTIDHTAITNVYNDGANTLREFLRYADAVSRGDAVAARGVLSGRRGQTADAHESVPSIVGQLADALTARGLDVATNVGQSAFRCDLALRRPGQSRYDVAVLVDHGDRLARDTFGERRLTQPSALRSAGWQVVQVLATDWLHHPDDVLDTLVATVDDCAGD